MPASSIEVKVDHNTEKIRVLEERVDKNVKKINETIIDVKGIKKEMNLMNGNVKILVENDKKIVEGIDKIDQKIPAPWFFKIKFWQILILLFVILIIIGMFA